MLYVSYNKEEKVFNVATNIRGIAEAIKLPYHSVYRQMKDLKLESVPVEYGKFVFGTIDKLLKGKQRYHGETKINDKKNETRN